MGILDEWLGAVGLIVVVCIGGLFMVRVVQVCGVDD